MIPLELNWLWMIPAAPIGVAILGFPLAERVPRGVVFGILLTTWMAVSASTAALFWRLYDLGGGDQIAQVGFSGATFFARSPLNVFTPRADSLTILMMSLLCIVGLVTLLSIPFAQGGGERRTKRAMTKTGGIAALLIMSLVLLACVESTLAGLAIAWITTSFISSALLLSERPRDEDVLGVLKLFALHRLGDVALFVSLVVASACFDSFDPKGIIKLNSLSPLMNAELARTLVSGGTLVAIASRLSPLWVPSYFRNARTGPAPTVAFLHAFTGVALSVWLFILVLPMLGESMRGLCSWVMLLAAFFALIRAALDDDILCGEMHITQAFGALSIFSFSFGNPSAGALSLFIALLSSVTIALPVASVIEAFHGETELAQMGGVWKSLRLSDFTRALAAFATGAFPCGGLFLVLIHSLYLATDEPGIFALLALVGVTGTYATSRLFYLPFAGEGPRGPKPSIIKDTDWPRRLTGIFAATLLCTLPILYALPSSLTKVVANLSVVEVLAQLLRPALIARRLPLSPLVLNDRLVGIQITLLLLLAGLTGYVLARRRFRAGSALPRYETYEQFIQRFRRIENVAAGLVVKNAVGLAVAVRTVAYNFLLDGVLTRVTSGLLALLRMLTRVLHSGDVQRAFALIMLCLAIALYIWGGS